MKHTVIVYLPTNNWNSLTNVTSGETQEKTFSRRHREDEDVVQIDYDYAFWDKILKDVVHHRLEGGGTVRKAKEHDQGFEQAAVGSEGSLPLVSFLYPDVVKAPADV